MLYFFFLGGEGASCILGGEGSDSYSPSVGEGSPSLKEILMEGREGNDHLGLK